MCSKLKIVQLFSNNRLTFLSVCKDLSAKLQRFACINMKGHFVVLQLSPITIQRTMAFPQIERTMMTVKASIHNILMGPSPAGSDTLLELANELEKKRILF